MTKSEVFDRLSVATQELGESLNDLARDMVVYTAQCGEAQIMLKRYNKIMRETQKIMGEFWGAIAEMSKNSKCVVGDYEG